jgi:hypothetical protein
MTKPDLSTQADRWRYLLSGGKIKHNDFIVGFKNDILWNYTQGTRAYMAFTDNEDCVPYIEPMSDEFECYLGSGVLSHFREVEIANDILTKYIGKRVKIKITEVI